MTFTYGGSAPYSFTYAGTPTVFTLGAGITLGQGLNLGGTASAYSYGAGTAFTYAGA